MGTISKGFTLVMDIRRKSVLKNHALTFTFDLETGQDLAHPLPMSNLDLSLRIKGGDTVN